MSEQTSAAPTVEIEHSDRSQPSPGTGVQVPNQKLESSANESSSSGPLQPSSGTYRYPEVSEDCEDSGDVEEIQVSRASAPHASRNTITGSAQGQNLSVAIDGLLIQGNLVIDNLPGLDSRVIMNGVLHGHGSNLTITGAQVNGTSDWANGVLRAEGPYITMGSGRVNAGQAFINAIPEHEYFELGNAHNASRIQDLVRAKGQEEHDRELARCLEEQGINRARYQVEQDRETAKRLEAQDIKGQQARGRERNRQWAQKARVVPRRPETHATSITTIPLASTSTSNPDVSLYTYSTGSGICPGPVCNIAPSGFVVGDPPTTEIVIAPDAGITTLNVGGMHHDDVSITATRRLDDIRMIARNTSMIDETVGASACASPSCSCVSMMGAEYSIGRIRVRRVIRPLRSISVGRDILSFRMDDVVFSRTRWVSGNLWDSWSCVLACG
jgi:hypothetical protein